MKHKLFRGLGAILFKEFIVVARDPLTLFFFFFPPLIEMVAFGYALDNDIKHMAMLVLNEDRSVESRLLIDRFVNTETFRVVGEVHSLDELKSEMRKGRDTPRWIFRRILPVTLTPATPPRCNYSWMVPIPQRRCKPSTRGSAWR